MLRVLGISLLVAGSLWLMVATAGLLILAGRHERLLSIQTTSMLPSFRPGDAVVVQSVGPSQLQPGDVISYRNVQNPRTIISHRLVHIDQQTGWLITAGDALSSPDPAFSSTQLVGRVTAVVPRFGKLLDALYHPAGLLFIVYLPALSIIVVEVRRLARTYTRPFYSVRLET